MPSQETIAKTVLEGLLEATPDWDSVSSLTQDLLERLPTAAALAVIEYLELWYGVKKRTEDVIRGVRQEAKKTMGREPNAEALGWRFVVRAGAQLPKGRVEYHQEQGYIALTCYTSGDYRRIHEALAHADYVASGGFFMSSGVSPFLAPLVVYNRPPSTETVTHERRHFFNDLQRDRMIAAERRISDNHVEARAHIKDEVIAFFEDGRGKMVGEILRGSLYKDLFENFSEEERCEVIQILYQISAICHDFSEWKKDVRIRRMIAHDLLNVPLRGVPGILMRIGSDFRKVHQLMKAELMKRCPKELVEDGMRSFSSDLLPLLEDTFPVSETVHASVRKAAKELITAIQRLCYGPEVFLNGDVQQRALSGFENQLDSFYRAIAQVKRNGVLLPHCWKDPESRLPRKKVDQVRNVILKSLSLMPQETIDALFVQHCTERASQRILERQLLDELTAKAKQAAPRLGIHLEFIGYEQHGIMKLNCSLSDRKQRRTNAEFSLTPSGKKYSWSEQK